MKKAYVIGPINAKTPWEVEQNIRRAEEATLTLLKMGYTVYCPHLQARFIRGILSEDFLCYSDLEWLSLSDIAVIYSSISNSSGSIAEVKFCIRNKIPVYRLECNGFKSKLTLMDEEVLIRSYLRGDL